MKAHSTSIRELCANDYTPDQIARWSDVNYDREIWERSVQEQFHLVVLKSGRIEGFCHAAQRAGQQGNIAGLYFTRAIAGQGFGRKAVSMAFDYLREAGCTSVDLNSTVTSRVFYERMGFRCVEPRETPVRGVVLSSFYMMREL